MSRMKRLKSLAYLGFPAHFVDNEGTVYGTKTGKRKALKYDKDRRGYPSVVLQYQGLTRKYLVSHLVLLTFVGPKPEGYQACHYPDRDVSNNRVENLRWDTCKNNHADREEHGTLPKGVKNGRAKLTDEDVLEIRRLRKEGYSAKSLGESFGVCGNQISWICLGRCWSHLPL